MKIAILGTRGIPNYYGGFEQCAEYLAVGLTQRNHEVFVYNSHNHPYQDSEWNNVRIIHKKDPEHKIGTMGQFVYDFNCIQDVKSLKCDIILQLGYTSSSIWGLLLPKNAIVTTNMDGLEWKRTKYSPVVRRFLLYAEELGIRHSDYLISDSLGIQKYLKDKYGKDSTYIPYGAHVLKNPDPAILEKYYLKRYDYDMLIARLEHENSIEIILNGVIQAARPKTFIVIGNHDTKYGEYLKEKYLDFPFIKFLNGIYDINILNNLRYYSSLYFHGHTVGGTNPSLLEAMACESLVCAHDNSFNQHILGKHALYFSTSEDISFQLNHVDKSRPEYSEFLIQNIRKIDTLYSWDTIIKQYEAHFIEILGEKSKHLSEHSKQTIKVFNRL